MKAEDAIVMPTMIKNAYKQIGVKHEQMTLLHFFIVVSKVGPDMKALKEKFVLPQSLFSNVA